jgi:hypothetical protein
MVYLKLAVFWVVFVACLGLQGCAQSLVVPLDYQPLVSKRQAVSTPIGLRPILDQRDQLYLGQSHSGSKYYPQGKVSAWVTQALRTELERSGCVNVSVLTPSVSARPGWVIWGSLQALSVEQLDLLRYRGQASMDISIWHNQEEVVIRRYSCQRERTTLASSDYPAQMLQGLLQDLLLEAVPDIVRRVTEQKGPGQDSSRATKS